MFSTLSNVSKAQFLAPLNIWHSNASINTKPFWFPTFIGEFPNNVFSILEKYLLWAQSWECRGDFKPFRSAPTDINCQHSCKTFQFSGALTFNIFSATAKLLWGNQLSVSPFWFFRASKTNSFYPFLLAISFLVNNGLISLFGFSPWWKSFWSLINHHSNNFRPKSLFP